MVTITVTVTWQCVNTNDYGIVITVTTHICCSESKCANDEINVTLLAVTVWYRFGVTLVTVMVAVTITIT